MKNKLVKKAVCFMGIMAMAAVFLGCSSVPKDSAEDIEKAKSLDLKSYVHSAGRNDMAGGCHQEFLMKDKDGIWTITCYDSECYEEPIIVTTYSVRAAKLIEFDAFIKERSVLELADREDSDNFITDYSPWYYSIGICDLSSGDSRGENYKLEEYKVYSEEDYELLKELDQKFADVYGKKISEEKKDWK